MKKVRCPGCYAYIGNVLEERDVQMVADELGYTQKEFEKGLEGERRENEPYTCPNCGTVFVPMDQGPVIS